MSKRRKVASEQGPKILPWSQSATGAFGEDELQRLRDEHPEDTAEAVWNPGSYVQFCAVCELLAHGNVQKAASVTRALVERHPECRNSLSNDFGPRGHEVVKHLLEDDLLTLRR